MSSRKAVYESRSSLPRVTSVLNQEVLAALGGSLLECSPQSLREAFQVLTEALPRCASLESTDHATPIAAVLRRKIARHPPPARMHRALVPAWPGRVRGGRLQPAALHHGAGGRPPGARDWRLLLHRERPE